MFVLDLLNLLSFSSMVHMLTDAVSLLINYSNSTEIFSELFKQLRSDLLLICIM